MGGDKASFQIQRGSNMSDLRARLWTGRNSVMRAQARLLYVQEILTDACKIHVCLLLKTSERIHISRRNGCTRCLFLEHSITHDSSAHVGGSGPTGPSLTPTASGVSEPYELRQ